jgi:hypothetical protein
MPAVRALAARAAARPPAPPRPPVWVEREGAGRVRIALRRRDGGADVLVLASATARDLGAALLDAGPVGEQDVAFTRLPGPGALFTAPAGEPSVAVAVDRAAGEWIVHGVPPAGPSGPGVRLTDAQARLLGADLIACARCPSAEVVDQVAD